jgi:6-phosphogluconolactonase (cycloisomerase 2 family)
VIVNCGPTGTAYRRHRIGNELEKKEEMMTRYKLKKISGKPMNWLAMASAACLLMFVAGAATAVQDKTTVYAALGEELSRYELDAREATLTRLGSLKLPVNLQFAEFHPDKRVLYAVSSNAGSGTLGAAGDKHLLSAFRIDAETGALYPHGESIPLPERPIHVTVDAKGEYALVAFNHSGTVKSYRLSKEGYPGEEVAQKEKSDGGIFTHQVVVTPSNGTVIALARGNEAVGERPSEIGSYSLFAYRNGQLELMRKVMYEEGIGPRHLAFHPAKPWVYVAIERTSKLFMYHLQANGEISIDPVFRKEALYDMRNEHRPRQKGGVVKIHPNGKFAYVTNRADGTIKKEGKTIFAGGENNIAVFSLDENTGEPSLIQHIDSGGIEARTYAVDASGTILLVANQKAMLVEDGSGLKQVDANFALFRIGQDGKLEFIRKYEVNAGSKSLLWMDMLDRE